RARASLMNSYRSGTPWNCDQLFSTQRPPAVLYSASWCHWEPVATLIQLLPFQSRSSANRSAFSSSNQPTSSLVSGSITFTRAIMIHLLDDVAGVKGPRRALFALLPAYGVSPPLQLRDQRFVADSSQGVVLRPGLAVDNGGDVVPHRQGPGALAVVALVLVRHF